MHRHFSLALGGGGARGLAHIGVIRRLEELSLTPTALAGTSMWAIIGTLLALGKTSHEMEEIMKDINFLSLIDPDLKHGMIKWKKIENFLDTLFEWKSFSDLSIPLTIVTTDIGTGERILFDAWRLSEAVRASISIPGVFVPKRLHNHELVDGWLTNNLPIELLPPWPVIAVSALRDLTRKMEKKRKILWLQIGKSIIGNSYDILQKTIDIMIAQNESRSCVSREWIIYIRPAFDKLDYYEFHKYREFIEAGYRAAKDIWAWNI